MSSRRSAGRVERRGMPARGFGRGDRYEQCDREAPLAGAATSAIATAATASSRATIA